MELLALPRTPSAGHFRFCFISEHCLRRMNAGVNNQPEFNFDKANAPDGNSAWLATRRDAAHELARKLNLPLGRQVEVWLRGNIRLRGMLRLKEEFLFVEEKRVRDLELVVDQVPFNSAEIESCVRLD